MRTFMNGIRAGDISQAFFLVSLDALEHGLPLLEAPALTLSERDEVRRWFQDVPSLEFFPYDIDFVEHYARLERALLNGKADELLRWACFSAPLTDPNVERDNWPTYRISTWLTALQEARKLGLLGYLDLGDASQTVLETAIDRYAARRTSFDAYAETLKKEWDPHDPAQITYNRKLKTPWDLFVYDNYCIPRSVSLDFATAFLVDHQEIRRFVLTYAEKLTEEDHAMIRKGLPQVVAGQGLYAHVPLFLDTLLEYESQSPETLLQFARPAS
jgi:hypothetical protein